MVDPASTVAFGAPVNHVFFIDVEKKGVIGFCGVVGVSSKGFLPADHLSLVFDDDLSLGYILQSKDTFAVDAGLTGFNAFVFGFFRFGGGHNGGHFNKKREDEQILDNDAHGYDFKVFAKTAQKKCTMRVNKDVKI